MEIALLVLIGLVAGVASGLFGVGGGLVIVPGLLFIMKLNFKTALGTSLSALLLPAGIFGVLEYYRMGHVSVKFAVFIVLGLLVGTLFGAKLAHYVSVPVLRRIYGIFLLFMAGKILFGK